MCSTDFLLEVVQYSRKGSHKGKHWMRSKAIPQKHIIKQCIACLQCGNKMHRKKFHVVCVAVLLILLLSFLHALCKKKLEKLLTIPAFIQPLYSIYNGRSLKTEIYIEYIVEVILILQIKATSEIELCEIFL